MRPLMIICFAGMMLTSCIALKPVSILEDSAGSETTLPHVGTFYAVNILRDQLSSEVWFTENLSCLQVKAQNEVVAEGSGAFYLKWNKPEGGCEWIGMGIGWDNWSPKDLSPIINQAAIQFKSRLPLGKIKSLPLAVSLEDYTGNAAWLGVLPEFIVQSANDSWATVTLPLERFGWDEFGADAGNIKQMIVQFEASGEAYIDELMLVPYNGLKNQRYEVPLKNNLVVKVDGDLSEWNSFPEIELQNHKIWITVSKDSLFIASRIYDNFALERYTKKMALPEDLGITLAFGMNPDARDSRKQMLLTDQLIFIRTAEPSTAFNVREPHEKISTARVWAAWDGEAYNIECAIPMSYFPVHYFQPEKDYGLEIAINTLNHRNESIQHRWNSPFRLGFDTNPSLWGIMTIQKSSAQ